MASAPARGGRAEHIVACVKDTSAGALYTSYVCPAPGVPAGGSRWRCRRCRGRPSCCSWYKRWWRRRCSWKGTSRSTPGRRPSNALRSSGCGRRSGGGTLVTAAAIPHNRDNTEGCGRRSGASAGHGPRLAECSCGCKLQTGAGTCAAQCSTYAAGSYSDHTVHANRGSRHLRSQCSTYSSKSSSSAMRSSSP